MRKVFITLYGAKHKISTYVDDNFIDQLNTNDHFISVIKRKRYCIVNKESIIEINEVPQKEVKEETPPVSE